jgi:hypothetical protein
MEAHMLDYSIRQPEGILVLKPQGPLSKEDFDGLTTAVDSYLTEHPTLHGVLVHSREFPGWQDLGGFAAHMRFFRDHHKKVERVAVVTDSQFAGIAESLGKHFISAEIRKFPFPDDAKAMDWLEAS